MSDDEEILGRLPKTRPGRRSPRRDEAAKHRARSQAKASASKARARQDPAGAEPPVAAPGADPLTGLAKTGVAIATGTVGLGLRVAGGALKAIRGTVERS